MAAVRREMQRLGGPSRRPRRCYRCGQTDHLVRSCPRPRWPCHPPPVGVYSLEIPPEASPCRHQRRRRRRRRHRKRKGGPASTEVPGERAVLCDRGTDAGLPEPEVWRTSTEDPSTESWSPADVRSVPEVHPGPPPLPQRAPRPPRARRFSSTVDTASDRSLDVRPVSLMSGQPLYRMEMVRPDNQSLGFSLAGCKDADGQLGFFVKTILPGGLADRDGRLEECDQILEVNGCPLTTIAEATRLLQSSATLSLLLTREEDL